MGIQGLNTGYTAIRAAQAALDTISHNIANATTEGYTRQRVDQTSLPGYATGSGILGQGVDIASISRQRDHFLDEQARTEDSRFAGMNARSQLLSQAEVRFGELDAGIDVSLGEAFASLEELALHPESTPVRHTVLDALDNVATRLRATAEGLHGLELAADTDVRVAVSEANNLITQIADLNGRIVGLSGAGSPNDLLDQRDRLVDQLSSLTGAESIRGAHGAVRVSLNGLSLVDGISPVTLHVDASGTVTHPDGAIRLGGEIGGLVTFTQTDLPAMQAKLDAFATELATAFNTQNAAGFMASGAAGGPLFAIGGGARDLQMVATGPADLAVAGSSTAATFDGGNAQAMADLRTTNLAGGGTLLARFRDVVTGVGVTAARAASDLRSQQSLQSASSLARESRHGVSLDEEMTNLIAHQRALEAAARVMSAIDETLGTLINRTGVVGR